MSIPLSRKANVASWIAQVLAALILAQTLFFKFTAAPESVALFTTLGVEPWGRWLVGLLELGAVILLLRPVTAAFGGVLGMALMVGAVGSHVAELGIEVDGDGGTLFGMALLVLIACATVTGLRWRDLPGVRRWGKSDSTPAEA